METGLDDYCFIWKQSVRKNLMKMLQFNFLCAIKDQVTFKEYNKLLRLSFLKQFLLNFFELQEKNFSFGTSWTASKSPIKQSQTGLSLKANKLLWIAVFFSFAFLQIFGRVPEKTKIDIFNQCKVDQTTLFFQIFIIIYRKKVGKIFWNTRNGMLDSRSAASWD